MRTRSSRRGEESGEPEELPEIPTVSTRRRGRKPTAKAAQKTPVAEQKTDISIQQPASEERPPEALTVLRTVDSIHATDNEKADLPAEGHMHEAAAPSDATKGIHAEGEADMDFLEEGTNLAEALLQASRDEDQAPSPAATEDKPPQISQQTDNCTMDPSAAVMDAEDPYLLTAFFAASRMQEHSGPGMTCPAEMPSTARSRAVSSDEQADKDSESDNAGEPSQGPRVAQPHTLLQPPPAAQEDVMVQPGAISTSPQDRPEKGEGSSHSGAACDQPQVAPLKRATSNSLHVRRSLRSGSLDAYERGRKSGIWHGATNASMGALEEDWDSYKATTLRGWTMPSLKDAQEKSKALASSGFTVVSSPKIRPASRSKLQADKPARAENKRKAGSGAQDASAAPRKAPKVGETPGKVQAAAKGRAWAASPSRFKQNASSSLLASKGSGSTRNKDMAGGRALKPFGERIPRPQKAG